MARFTRGDIIATRDAKIIRLLDGFAGPFEVQWVTVHDYRINWSIQKKYSRTDHSQMFAINGVDEAFYEYYVPYNEIWVNLNA
jgi:hypothetical protein